MKNVIPSNIEMLGPVSPSVLDGKDIVLGRELNWFYNQLKQSDSKDYFDGIEKIVEDTPELNEIDDSIKMIVTVPVHVVADYSKIYGVLSLYARQAKINLKSVLILLNLNWRKKEKYDQKTIDSAMNSAYEQINRARKDFPKLKIAVFNQPRHNGIFFVAKCMNDVMMFALRRAIKEKRLSPNADIIAIRNDSDILHMHKEYLASYLEAAEQNPSTPVFYAHSWPSISQSYLSPGFAASVFLDRELNYLHNQKGDIFTAGGNFGYRVQHFAAVNGFGYNCEHLWKRVGSDDIQIGYRIRLGFFEKALRENFLIGVFVPNAIVDTDCTRYLYTYMDDNQALVDAYRENNKQSFINSPFRPDITEPFIELLDDKKVFARIVMKFENEASNYFEYYGLNDDCVYGTIKELLGAYAHYYYDVFPEQPSNPHSRILFRLNDYGKTALREILMRKYGDGKNVGPENHLYHMIEDGTLLSAL